MLQSSDLYVIELDDIKRFKQRLIDKENPPDKINEAIKLLSDYYDFLQTKNKNFDNFNSEDFYEFSRTLIEQEKNTGFSYEVFIIFGQFIENYELIKLG